MPECWLLFRGKVLLNSMRILMNGKILDIVTDVKLNELTPRMSHASITRVQSWSDILNADHGMCFTSQLSHHKVVIGPYITSADVTNRPIGCQTALEYVKRTKEWFTWWSLFAWSSILYTVPHRILLCSGIFKALGNPQHIWVLSENSIRWPKACI